MPETEIDRYRNQARDLLGQIKVSKDMKFDAACIRDNETGAIICASKRYINDNLHREAVYVEIGGSTVFAKGDTSDILEMKQKLGL